MVLVQTNAAEDPRVQTFRDHIAERSADKREELLTKFGSILAAGSSVSVGNQGGGGVIGGECVFVCCWFVFCFLFFNRSRSTQEYSFWKKVQAQTITHSPSHAPTSTYPLLQV